MNEVIIDESENYNKDEEIQKQRMEEENKIKTINEEEQLEELNTIFHDLKEINKGKLSKRKPKIINVFKHHSIKGSEILEQKFDSDENSINHEITESHKELRFHLVKEEDIDQRVFGLTDDLSPDDAFSTDTVANYVLAKENEKEKECECKVKDY